MKTTLFALIILITAVSLQARPTWHSPEAKTRIRFNIPRKTRANLLVPIPRELKPADIVAFDDKGMVIPASPVRQDGVIVAAVVDGTKQAAPFVQHNYNLNASLYLLDKSGVQSLPYAGRPVHFSRLVKDLTTRAHTGEETLRMLANLYQIPYPNARRRAARLIINEVEGDAFGLPYRRKNWLTLNFKKSRPFTRAFIVASAYVNLQQDQTLALGTDQLQVGWTILVDSVPVADWVTADDQACGKPVTLKKGLHAIQLVSVQSQHEKLPALLVRKKAGARPEPFQELLPPHTPDTLKLEFKDIPQLSPETETRPLHAYTFPHAQPPTALAVYSVNTPDKRCQFLDDRQQPVTLPAPRTLISGNFRKPAIRLTAATQTFTFMPPPPLWHLNQALDIQLKLKTPPILQNLTQLRLELSLDYPHAFPEDLRNRVTIAITQRSGQHPQGGKILTQLTMKSEGNRFILQPKLFPVSSVLRLQAQLGNVPITAPRLIHLITPFDAGVPLRAMGDQLFGPDGYATLLAPVPQTQPPTAEPPRGNQLPTRAIVYDDTLFTTIAPQADLLPQDSRLTWMPVTAPRGADQTLAFLANLHRLLALAPPRALFIVNPQMAAQPDGLWKTQLLFATIACKLAQIRPEIVILPDIKHDSRFADARQAAFNVKQFAYANGLRVQDLYTLAQLQNLDTEDWKMTGTLGVTSLNNHARAWFFKQIN